jgi:two-component system NtrC family sensor kinase
MDISITPPRPAAVKSQMLRIGRPPGALAAGDTLWAVSATSFGLAAALIELFDKVPQGIYFGRLDGQGATTLAANPHLKLMLGCPPETAETAVRPFDPQFLVDADARASLRDRLGRDGGATDLLLRLRRSDGAAVWVEVTVQATAQAPDGSFGIAAIFRDVTERKRLDDQGRELYQQLLQAEKLAALGQTISGVAHELNNPLATILASAERLVLQPADPTLKRALETIRGEAERAARIVRSLLTFARKRHTTRTMVDVNEIVRETLALRQYEQRLSNVTVIEALASGLPQVFADPHQLQQVLLNLVINAEQAMLTAHGRGTLVLRSWHDPSRDAVVLEVNDDGPGVPPETAAKIFDPFFTTKAAGEGTGLGLTVAYAIIQEHGGRLTMRSPPGRGASFVAEFPTGGTGVVASARPVDELPANIGGGARVLVVDDEAALAQAVADGLREAGFVVELASDGEEALAAVDERSFDVIVCDLRMPRMDGAAFYRAIATKAPPLARRLIFVTGDVAGTEAGRFLESSGCRWLPKPFRLADLVRAARDVAG